MASNPKEDAGRTPAAARLPRSRGLFGTALLVLVLLVAVLTLNPVYTVESGEVVVLSTFGRYDPEPRLPGLHFRMPLVQGTHFLDVRLQTLNFRGREDAPDGDGILNHPGIQVLDAKNLPITLDLSLQFTPHAAEAAGLLERYGRNYADRLIVPLVREVVRDVVGGYQSEQIANQRSEIGRGLEAKLIEALKAYPFTVENVALREIVLPAVVQKKIEEVQLAKQEEQRLAMVEQQARKEQEIKTIQANTRLVETTTDARAQAERRKLEADANAYQIAKEAEARATANQKIAASLTAELVHYQSVLQWNGVYPATLVQGGGAGLLLNLPAGGPAVAPR